MKSRPAPRVVDAEIFAGGALITFDNGLYTVFPPELLYASRALADIMNELRADAESKNVN